MVVKSIAVMLQSVLPSVVTSLDAAQLVQMAIQSHKNALVLADTVVTTQQFINSCAAPFEKIMEEKARKVIYLVSGSVLLIVRGIRLVCLGVVLLDNSSSIGVVFLLCNREKLEVLSNQENTTRVVFLFDDKTTSYYIG